MTPFIKMHGLGNDFAIIDERQFRYKYDVKQIANRKLGIGCDQVIIIEKSSQANCAMQIYNRDGSKAEACGNATRCVAQIITEEQNSQEATIEIEEKILKCQTAGVDRIKVDMGIPLFDWEKIPLSKPCDTENLPITYEKLENPIAINTGNPHVIFFVEDINSVNLAEIGPKVENHSLFPQKVNVNIAQVTNEKILLKVWERGAGETLACGSGACATLAAAVKRKYIVNNGSIVSLPGGELYIEWNKSILMTGPVKKVFIGTIIN
ncbi:MAG: diaminopimelate epimerase [Rickettsiaceae bacterium H1]|nr:diaminopimelate epimerase [Rickettsiaceae bacterium H1]